MSDSIPASKLDAIFKPSSIAVVGASTRPGTVGNDIFRNLLFNEFRGSVYPINPKAGNVLSVHCYPDLASVPGKVDLAVVIVPAAGILDVVDQAIAKQVQAMVVISAGFKEVGSKGAELEKQLQQKVRAAGMPLIGPNCLGVNLGTGHQPADRPCPRPRLLGGRQPSDAPPPVGRSWNAAYSSAGMDPGDSGRKRKSSTVRAR